MEYIVETIRKAIIKGLKKVDIGNGKKITPMSIPWTFRSIALLLVIDAIQNRLGENIDDEAYKGILTTLSPSSLTIESLSQGAQFDAFIDWWLDQEAVMEDGWDDEKEEFDDSKARSWYWWDDAIEKWNQFAINHYQKQEG